MRVVVTGAGGMLGSALIKRIIADGNHEVVGIDRSTLDLADSEALRGFLVHDTPDVLIHAAAKVGGIQANMRDPFAFLADNLSIDTAVIGTSADIGVKHLIYLGSSCMYPKDYRQPLKETDLLKAPLEPTNEGYALAKIAGSKLCEYASITFGLNYKTLVPSNLYGPGDKFNSQSSHLIASIVSKVHEAKKLNQDFIEVWGSGSARREFTYIGDLAQWISSNLEKVPSLPPILNLGIGTDHTIDEFYRVAMEVMNYEVPLVHDVTRPEGMKAKLMDSSLARTQYGWAPKTSIHEGISRTYEWFLEQVGDNEKL